MELHQHWEFDVRRDGLPDHEFGPSTPPPQSAPPWTFSTKYVEDATSLNRPPMHGRGDPPLRAAHASSQLCPATVLNTHCCPPAEVVGLQADASVEPAADTWPAGQAVHGGLPLGPKKPALHVQAAEVVDPEGLLEPEGQSVQVTAPVPLLCLSAAQSVQVAAPVAALCLPGGHLRRKRRRPEREKRK